MKLSSQILCWGRCPLTPLLAFSLLASCPSSLTLAGGGFSYVGPRMPNNTIGYSTQSGLQIKVNSSWVGNRGYWPFQIQVDSATAATADRQITIRFSASRWRNRPNSITVEQDFELAQGDTTASIKLLVPQLTDWDRCNWEVWVDGFKDEQLSLQFQQFNRTNNGSNIAMIVPRVSGTNMMHMPFPDLVDYGGLDLAANESELSKKWLDYSSVDVVFATPKKLIEWQSGSPERFEELLRWVRAGGNLWIAALGANRRTLPKSTILSECSVDRSLLHLNHQTILPRVGTISRFRALPRPASRHCLNSSLLTQQKRAGLGDGT